MYIKIYVSTYKNKITENVLYVINIFHNNYKITDIFVKLRVIFIYIIISIIS